MSSAYLYIALTQDRGRSIDFDKESQGVSAHVAAEGYVWNTDSKFDRTRCRVTFYNKESERLNIAARQQGLGFACGGVEISADLKPETFVADGETLSIEPLAISIFLTGNDYTEAEHLLSISFFNKQTAHLSVVFFHPKPAQFMLPLCDVDTSSKQSFFILRFGLSYGPRANRQVVVPKHDSTSSTLKGLTFECWSANVGLSTWNSALTASEIKLTGKLRCKAFDLILEDSTIVLKEYERTGRVTRDYPEEAFAGIISISKSEMFTFCDTTLFATEDALNRFADLFLSLSKGDMIRLDILFITDRSHLSIGDSEEFSVTGFTPSVFKNYLL